MVVQSGGHKNLANVSKATDSIKVFMKKLLRPEGYSSSSGSGSKSSSVSDTSVNHKLTYKKLIAQASIESDSSSDGKSNHSNSSSSQSEQEEASSLEDIQVESLSIRVSGKTSSSESDPGNSQQQLLVSKQSQITNIDIYMRCFIEINGNN